MSYRTITLSPDHQFLFVTSEYNEEIRLLIKSFSGASWNSPRKVWSVPVQHTAVLLDGLAPYDFLVSEEIRTVQVPAGPTVLPAPLSVSEVTARVSRTISERFPDAMWVTGELSSFDKGAMRRHLYFELIEKVPNQDEIAARLSAVIFHQQRLAIEERLARAPEALELRDGLNVLVHGRLDFYPRTGRLQFLIDDVDPYFTLGELAKRRQEILEQLRVEGLLQRNLRLPWPALPLRIGLITAADSDALHDFMQTLRQSNYGFEVHHFAAAVQGPRLEAEILRALDFFEARAQSIDLVVIIRGGGPRSDLAWFDNLRVARKVATHPVKVVIGIGHERDRSVLDEVAASEKTPTALAEMLVSRVVAAEDALDSVAQRLVQRTRQRLLLEQERHRHQKHRLLANARQSLERAGFQVEARFAIPVEQAVRSRVRVEKARIRQLAWQLRPIRVSQVLGRLNALADSHERKLLLHAPRSIDQEKRQLDLAQSRLHALDPTRMLARGYAIVRNEGGQLVRHPDTAPPGSRITVTLGAGKLTARVESHHTQSLSPDTKDTAEIPGPVGEATEVKS